MDINTPVSADGKTFEGFTVPPVPKGFVRMGGGKNCIVFYKEPSAQVTPGVDTTIAMRFGIPVPQFMCPLNLFKRILVDVMKNTAITIKEGYVDQWESLTGYQESINQNQELMDAIERIIDGKAPT